MSTPSAPATQHSALAQRDTTALAETANLLRDVARHDGQTDLRRGDISATLAALVDAIGRGYGEVPFEVATVAMSVVAAVDRATGRRRA
jgi:hypothetical protein